MLYETHACIYNKRMLIVQDCSKFCWCRARAYARQKFIVNNFAHFLDVVRVKKSRFHSVIGGVWSQQHLLLNHTLIDMRFFNPRLTKGYSFSPVTLKC